MSVALQRLCPMKKAGSVVSLPLQPIYVAHSYGLHQHNEQQGQGGCIVIEYAKPVVPGLHGEHHTNGTVDEAHQTWNARSLLISLSLPASHPMLYASRSHRFLDTTLWRVGSSIGTVGAAQ